MYLALRTGAHLEGEGGVLPCTSFRPIFGALILLPEKLIGVSWTISFTISFCLTYIDLNHLEKNFGSVFFAFRKKEGLSLDQ